MACRKLVRGLCESPVCVLRIYNEIICIGNSCRAHKKRGSLMKSFRLLLQFSFLVQGGGEEESEKNKRSYDL